MDIIPHPLLLDIVRRVAHHGFRELGSLIASGPDFMAMVFDRSVLAGADIDEFVFVTFHANVDSIYRSFFCVVWNVATQTHSLLKDYALLLQKVLHSF